MECVIVFIDLQSALLGDLLVSLRLCLSHVSCESYRQVARVIGVCQVFYLHLTVVTGNVHGVASFEIIVIFFGILLCQLSLTAITYPFIYKLTKCS